MIVRTAAHGAKREDFERELEVPAQAARGARQAGSRRRPPRLWSSRRPTCRCASCATSSRRTSSGRSSTTSSSTTASCRSSRAPPRSWSSGVELWEQPEPLFEAYGVDKAIDGLLSRRVDLPSGGYLIIDYAEALTVIDVNSGSFIGRGKGAGSRTRSPRRTSRPPRRSSTSCACATSAGSS